MQLANLKTILISVFIASVASATSVFAQATGGTVTEVLDGGSTYRVHTFTNGGTFAVSSPIANVEYLIVAGGGGGGGESGGGGSGGGVRTGTVATTAGNFSIVIGNGGTGGVTRGADGTNGGDSSFNGIIATGGGRGKTARLGNATGGAGGGGVWSSTSGLTGVAGQIEAGGNSNGAHGGGGGGAGTAGQNAGGSAGNGGDGKLSTISGAATYYGGGGGGGKSKNSGGNAGTGGLGGGGNGSTSGNGNPGTANTGGGGGGGINTNGFQGGTGGSGIVILRYLVPSPTANAGSNQTVVSAANVTLNGSGTSFAIDQSLTYAWTQTAGTVVALSSNTASQPSFTSPTLLAGDADATLTFSLIVTDNLGQASTADTIDVTVTAPGNTTPTANAGPNQTVTSAASVTLDGSASSDSDPGQSLTYAWTQTAGTVVALSSNTASQPSFTSPTLLAGDADATLTFSLIVTDNLGQASTADTIDVTVTAPGIANSKNTLITSSHTVVDTIPANDSTEAEITVTLFDQSGNILADGGNNVVATTNLGTLRQNPSGVSIPMRDNRNGTYSVWLRSDSEGIATVSITVDNLASGSIRIVFTQSALNVVNESQETIAGFLLERTFRLVSNQPNLTQFLGDEHCGHLNASINDSGGLLDGCVQSGHVWHDMKASWGKGTRFVQGTAGAHTKVTPNFLFGGMFQFDDMSYESEGISGNGWMAGPYFAAKLPEQPLFFEGRILFGKSNNTINALGFYTDEFETNRWLGQFKVEGGVRLEKLSLRPSLSVIHAAEYSMNYIDTPGNTIASQSASSTQLSAGVEFEVPFPVEIGNLNLNGGVAANYTASQRAGVELSEGNARIHLGLDWKIDQRLSLSGDVFQDGIGTEHGNYGANMQITIGF